MEKLFGLDRRRLILGGLVTLVIIVLIIVALVPQSVPVDIGLVDRGELVVRVTDEGETRVKDIYTVSAPLEGRLLRVEAEVGDHVQAYNTVLVAIEPSSPRFLDIRTRAQAESAVEAAKAARALAQAEVARAQAELDFARSELERAEALAQRGNISGSALDRARLLLRTRESEVATSQASLRVKDFELETARAALIDPGGSEPKRTPENCCVPIYSPVDGSVLQIIRESEGVVSAGTPLIEIGDPSKLEIVVDLLSTDAVKVKTGAAVLIDDWGGDHLLNGRVRRVEPFGFTKISALGIEEQRVNVVIDLTDPVAKWSALGHGYRVEAHIIIWREDSVVRLPLSALFRAGNDWAIFTVENGRARLTRVTIGHTNTTSAEVLDGVAVDQQIILHPSDRVEDGVRVEARSG